jgi:myosin heavy subunit
VEKANRDALARHLFDQTAAEAERLDASLGAMREEVQATKDMAAPLHAEAKLTREGLGQTAEAFKSAVSEAAAKSANWVRLQKQLQETVTLLESYVKMLDDSVRAHAQAEFGRIKAQDLALSQRLTELKRAEAEIVQAHENSALLVARLESENARVEAEIGRLGESVALDAERVARFDELTAKMRSLAELEQAKELQALKLRMAYAESEVRESEVRGELERMEKSKAGLAEKLKNVAGQTSEIARRREAVRIAGVDVRNAESERDNNILALGREEKSLADMIKDGDPRLAARDLLDKAKSIRGQIAEVEEGRRLLADGDAEIAKHQARLDDLLQGSSFDGLQSKVRGSHDALVVLERAIIALEDALAGDEILRRNPIAADKVRSWDRFRSEATRRLQAARSTYLRSRNPLDPPLLDEINAAIESLKQLP